LADLPQAKNEQKTPIKKSPIRETIEMIVMALILYILIDAVVARVVVQKISMFPTLVPGEVLLVNKLQYKFSEVEHGEIITFHYPLDPELDYVKRAIGLPGDEVIIKNGEVMVNDRLLDEPYISAAPEYEGIWNVPDEALFVLGDNRNPSADSHVWGFVPMDNLIGKAFAVYWPPGKIRGLKTPDIFTPES